MNNLINLLYLTISILYLKEIFLMDLNLKKSMDQLYVSAFEYAYNLPLYFLKGIILGAQKIEFDIAKDILANKKAKLEQSEKDFFTPATLLKAL